MNAKIQKEFKELIGQGFNASPAYKGGLFEDKFAAIEYDNGYRLGHVQSIIYSLPSNKINNSFLLLKLIQENLSLNRIEGDGSGYQEIMAWFHHTDLITDKYLPQKDTLKHAFMLMCDSFASLEEAYKAKKLYHAFLVHTNFNPWTPEKKKLPGYEMLVYLQNCEKGIPYKILPEEYDEACPISQNKFLKEADRIYRRRNDKRFTSMMSKKDLQDRAILECLASSRKTR